jgi:hypothetical protein
MIAKDIHLSQFRLPSGVILHVEKEAFFCLIPPVVTHQGFHRERPHLFMCNEIVSCLFGQTKNASHYKSGRRTAIRSLVQYGPAGAILDHEALHFVTEKRIRRHSVAGVIVPRHPTVTVHIPDTALSNVVIRLVRVPEKNRSIEECALLWAACPAKNSGIRITICTYPRTRRIRPTQS